MREGSVKGDVGWVLTARASTAFVEGIAAKFAACKRATEAKDSAPGRSQVRDMREGWVKGDVGGVLAARASTALVEGIEAKFAACKRALKSKNALARAATTLGDSSHGENSLPEHV